MECGWEGKGQLSEVGSHHPPHQGILRTLTRVTKLVFFFFLLHLLISMCRKVRLLGWVANISTY